MSSIALRALCAGALGLAGLSPLAAESAVLTFEGAEQTGPFDQIESYGPFEWMHVAARVDGNSLGSFSAVQEFTNSSTVVYNPFDLVSTIALNDPAHEVFTFESAVLAAAYRNNLDFTAVGYRDGLEVHRKTIKLHYLQVQEYSFDFTDIDTLTLAASGGEIVPILHLPQGRQYVMDNFRYALPNSSVPSEGLLVHYRLDGDGADSSGNGRHLSMGTSASYSDGEFDEALSLKNDRHGAGEDADAEEYLLGLDALTVSTWIKSKRNDTDSGWLNGSHPNGSSETLMMRYDRTSWYTGQVGLANVRKCLQLSIATTEGIVAYESRANRQTTNWQHVVLVWQSGSLPKVYVDGVEDMPAFVGLQVGNVVQASVVSNGTISGIDRLVVGRSSKDGSGSWNGLVDQVRIYDRALPAEAVHALFTEQRANLTELLGDG